MECLYCKSKKISDSFLPSTFYNQKRFDYKRCMKCKLIFINPLPNNEDLLKMYPPSYQDGVDHSILKNPHKKLTGLRYSYGFQFDLLKKINFKGKILDFGCGTANFLINCNYAGYICDGLEFNPKHVEILKKELPKQNFFTVDEFLKGNKKYDLIRLSNVLEHFTNPEEVMLQLKDHLSENGKFLLEGPIETNFNFALQFRKIYFSLRKKFDKKYIAIHKPTHITFSNRKNQIEFFNRLGLKTEYFKISEAEWPFPYSLKVAQGLTGRLNYFIAKLSVLINRLNPNWGNTFIYVGSKK